MSTSDSSVTMKHKKPKLLPYKCRVCDAPAECSHFGVITCPSCKIFFRRNGNIPQDQLKCPFDDHCEINVNTRHTCTSCRRAKCFECGMSTDLFRARKRIQSNTNIPVETSIRHQLEQFPTSNLLQSDTSLLTTSEWNLLSNLVNSYDESHLVSLGQRLIDTHNILQPTDIIYQTLIEEFIGSIYETTGEYLHLNDDLCNLPSEERSISLRNAADNISCMSGSIMMHHCHLFNLNIFLNAIETKYDKYTIDLHLSIMKLIDPDTTLIKLALSLFIFSQNTCSYFSKISVNLTNCLNILEIQNKYAEITWKYLLYRYGHHDAVKRFITLISLLQIITIFVYHAQCLTLHVDNVNSLVEQIELKLLLDDADDMMELDKTSN